MSAPGGDFSYSGDPATSDLDAVRFMVGDTNASSYLLRDAEINFLLTASASIGDGTTPNVLEAAGAAAEAIAAGLSREVSYSADGVSVSADTLAAKFYTVGEKIRTLSLRSDVAAGPDVGGVLYGEVYDDSIRPLVFSIGMHDNYLAGQQDFGGSYLPTARDYQSRTYMSVAASSAALVGQALTPVNGSGGATVSTKTSAASAVMPTKYPLSLYRGDTYRFQFVLYSDAAKTTPADLTNAVVKSEIRDQPAGDQVTVLDTVVTLPNLVNLTISAAQCHALPGTGAWDLQITFDDGIVQTVLAGAVSVTTDVTDSTP